MRKVTSPNEKWGPALDIDRGSRYSIPRLASMEFELSNPELTESYLSTAMMAYTNGKAETNGNIVGVENNGFIHS